MAEQSTRLVRGVVSLAVALAICFGVAGLGGWMTASNIPTWYAGIAKPSWTPPNWLFGPVWSLLYAMMAVAAWRVWMRAEPGKAAAPLAIFGVQLALNLAWSGLFFSLRSPMLGLVDIAALWVAIVATIVSFGRVSRLAAGLLIPYLLWVSFAAALNLAIWRLNP